MQTNAGALLRALSCAAIVLMGNNVVAQTAQITNLNISLIDLDLTDGIAPAISFSGPSSAVAGYMYVSGNSASRSSDSESGSEAFGEVSAFNNGIARLSGDVTKGEGFAFASAGPLWPGYVYTSALLTLAGPQFSLTPRTEVVISGLATVDRGAYLALELSGATSAGPQDVFFRMFSPNTSLTSTASVSFSNTDSDDLTGTFTGWLGAGAPYAPPVSAVPEPGSYLFLILGCAIVFARSQVPRLRPGTPVTIPTGSHAR